MQFVVVPIRGTAPAGLAGAIALYTDGWDDWFTYGTMYSAVYFDGDGTELRIGSVKIGQFGMDKKQYRPSIPQQFETLGEQFFSLGQDDSYYEVINEMGDEFRDEYLTALRDVAADEQLFELAAEEDVTQVSLLRSVSDSTVRGQFRRMTRGEARLTSFAFTYTPPPSPSKSRRPIFEFRVTPESSPPTNVHVLIGRNGVGKTHTLNLLTNAIVRPSDDEDELGAIDWEEADDETGFPNVVSVTFSAFDPFEPLSMRRGRAAAPKYHYVGLKHTTKDDDGNDRPPKSPNDLASDFGWSIHMLMVNRAKQTRWLYAVRLLESDRIFRRARIWRLIDDYDELIADMDQKAAMAELRKRARLLYGKLSSGHKIVLLTITCLVEALEERTLVLLDEPEAHLHPPLLSAFVRALSALLINRNGVAIIATHSPVILQEVPKTCVWRVRRAGRSSTIERPKIETFGENVGALTQEIFGLEVTDSGFHKLVSDAVDEGLDYEQLLARFGGQLGDEARAIARSLIATSEVPE